MKKVLIINANYYKDICKRLSLSAQKILTKNKIQHKTIDIPGVYEIPFTLKKFVKKYDAFIVLGCVIKGETPHFDLISRSAFDAIIRISVDHNKPITNGIITCFNMRQAIQRSSISQNSKKNNKGKEAADALVALLKNEPKNS